MISIIQRIKDWIKFDFSTWTRQNQDCRKNWQRCLKNFSSKTSPVESDYQITSSKKYHDDIMNLVLAVSNLSYTVLVPKEKWFTFEVIH